MQPTLLHADTLRRAPMFRALSESDCEALALCLRVRRCARGEVLFREGEPGTSMALVLRGMLVATTRAGGGKPREIGVIGAGEVAGEMAFLDPAPRVATVTATSDVELYEITQDAMDVLRARAPAAARALMAGAARSVSLRLGRFEERIDEELARPAGQGALQPSHAGSRSEPSTRPPDPRKRAAR